jgi:hypothetical protein
MSLSLIWAVSPGKPLRAMSIAPPVSGGITSCRLDVVREAGDRLGGGLDALLPGDLFGLCNDAATSLGVAAFFAAFLVASQLLNDAFGEFAMLGLWLSAITGKRIPKRDSSAIISSTPISESRPMS